MNKINQIALGVAMAMTEQASQATGAEPAGVYIHLYYSHETGAMFFHIEVEGTLVGSRMKVSETTLETLTERTAEAVAFALG